MRTPSTRWVPDVPRPIAGSVLPDVTLPDTTGALRRLAELPAGDPIVLHTYRGWFCPKDRAYFRQVLLPLQEVAEVGYVRMVSVSVEPPEVTAAFRAGLDARWTFLSDVDRTWQSALDLREVTFMDSSGLGVIVGQHKRAREEGFRFAVAVAGAAEVERILELSGLVAVLDIVDASDQLLAG